LKKPYIHNVIVSSIKKGVETYVRDEGQRKLLFKISRLVALISLMICAMSVYSESVAQLYRIEGIKCPIPWQVTYPNSTVTFNLILLNPSYFYDTFLLEIKEPSLPEGWKADFYFQNQRVKAVSIDRWQFVNLILLVKIPEDALPGDYNFTVHAEGEYSTSEITLTVTVESRIIKYEVDLYCPHEWQVTLPGKNLTFQLHLENHSPMRDNYLIYVENPSLPENWTARFFVENREVKSFTVPPGGAANIIMLVNVPDDASPGEYRFRVQVDGNYADATQGLTVTVEPIARGINLFCPFPSKSILTGQSVSYPISITNEGGRTEEVILEVVPTEETLGWDISLSETRLTLAPKESRWIMLNVKPPEIVEEKTYSIIVNGTTADNKLNSTLKLTTKILASYLLEITGTQPIYPQVYSGDKIDIVVTVRNLGQSMLTGVRLKINSTVIPNIVVTPLDILALEPKASANFNVRISPDPNLTPGDYSIQILAESSETKSSVRTIVVSVSSPIPWFWISIGIAIIATALVMILIQRVASKYGVKLSVRKRRTG